MENTENNKDAHLWELAQQRIAFKNHLATYISMNAFFWILWFFTGWSYTYTGVPWPVWPMAGWGIVVLLNYLNTYVYPKTNSVETEYETLKAETEGRRSEVGGGRSEV
jgi:hypothetical protein